MAEFYFTLAIMVYVSLVMIGIGIWQIRSKEPVGFYTGEKPPKEGEIVNISSYNKKHGMMWIVYGIAIMCSFLLSSIIDNPVISSVILIGTIVGALPIMIFFHEYMKKKYWKGLV